MGRKEDRIREDLKTLFDENLQKLLMTLRCSLFLR